MVGEIYLSGIEVNIEEYFLDNYTIVELVSSSIIYREYYEKDRYIFKRLQFKLLLNKDFDRAI